MGRERDIQRERDIDVRNIDWLPSVGTWTGDRTCDLEVGPDWESNWWLLVYLTLQSADCPARASLSFLNTEFQWEVLNAEPKAFE